MTVIKTIAAGGRLIAFTCGFIAATLIFQEMTPIQRAIGGILLLLSAGVVVSYWIVPED